VPTRLTSLGIEVDLLDLAELLVVAATQLLAAPGENFLGGSHEASLLGVAACRYPIRQRRGTPGAATGA
jgi:hypothetical protein